MTRVPLERVRLKFEGAHRVSAFAALVTHCPTVDTYTPALG